MSRKSVTEERKEQGATPHDSAQSRKALSEIEGGAGEKTMDATQIVT